MEYTSYICKTKDFSCWCLARIISKKESTIEILIDSTISPSLLILIGKSLTGTFIWIPDYNFGCSIPSFIKLRETGKSLVKVIGARNTAIILKGIRILYEDEELF